MKRTRLLFSTFLLLFLAGAGLQAQISATSSFLVGGTLSYNTSNSTVKVTQNGIVEEADGPTTSIFTFEPVIAYFILPNFAIGGQVSFTKEKITSTDDDYKVQNLLLGPIARYYVPILDNEAAFFLEVDAAFGSSSDDIVIGESTTSTDNVISQVGFGPGLTFFIGEFIGLEAIAKYNLTRSKATVESSTISYESINNANEFDFQIGLQFYFTR